jgi:hypothetical protein
MSRDTADAGEADAAAERRAALARLCAGGTTLADALALFDRCPAVALEDMRGVWRGTGCPTGHLLDGLLEHYGWYGKAFTDTERVDPLLFQRGNGTPFAVAPRLMPLGLAVFPRVARSRVARWLFDALQPVIRTTSPAARLRLLSYRGVVTATMVYDHLPIHDAFRRIDHDTLLGVMDWRGAPPFVFVLHRDRGR